MKMTFCFILSALVITEISYISLSEKKRSDTATCPDSKFIQASPTSLKASSEKTIAVKFYNSGNCQWKKGSVKLYANLISCPSEKIRSSLSTADFNGLGIRDSHPGYLLGSDIEPGEYYSFNFKIIPPRYTGQYKINYYLIQSMGRGKFGATESKVTFTVN